MTDRDDMANDCWTDEDSYACECCGADVESDGTACDACAEMTDEHGVCRIHGRTA